MQCAMMIKREIRDKLAYMATKFPIVTLTGVRQCGKSTLLRHFFPDYKYVSLEDLDFRRMAEEDPRGFIRNFPDRTIIDEAQHVPALFSYLQTTVDTKGGVGMYILSGSHNFLLMERVAQSLAGRTAVLRLAPFSIPELSEAGKLPATLDEWMFNGGFPRLYDKDIAPSEFFPSYIQTYVERDVRTARNVGDLSTFMRFLRLCAARVGQLLNIQSLANECGVNVQTANAWISVLESSYVLFLLRPYYCNFGKRQVKSPKLYFFDTGLVASLVGMTDPQQMNLHYLRGGLFENMVVMEMVKRCYAKGLEPQMYFWRDTNQNEVDLLVEEGTQLFAYEIKSGATVQPDFFKGLNRFAEMSGLPTSQLNVVYGGDESLHLSSASCLSWREL